MSRLQLPGALGIDMERLDSSSLISYVVHDLVRVRCRFSHGERRNETRLTALVLDQL